MTEIIAFNYEIITDPKVRNLARENAVQIRELLERTAEYVIEIGKRLRAMKEALPFEEFEAWWRAEFNFSRGTVTNYVQAWERFGDIDCIERFSPSAVCHLSRENIPSDLVDELVERARNGEQITHTTATHAIRARRLPKAHHGRPASRILIRLKDRRSLDHCVHLLRHAAPHMSRDELEHAADVFLELAMECRKSIPLEADELTPVH